MTINAKEILDNRFWIVEENGVKLGTISLSDTRFMFTDNLGTRFFENEKQLKKTFGKDFYWEKLEIKETVQEKVVHGFPTSTTPYNALYDVKQKLPLFTKSDKSKSLYCAGYYIIKFDKGWVKSFCPKLITIERYEYKGPFHTELEMRQELSIANTK
jgi:hypothetical protein